MTSLISLASRIDIVDLRLFLHVVDSGSITAGCKLSHLALASASARLRGMEDGIGMRLLERKRSGVVPTKAGFAVAHHARLILLQLELLQEELHDYVGGAAGTVRLLSNTAAISEYLPQALGTFLSNHPAIDIELEERPSHAIVARLLDGAADIGIVTDAVDLSQLEVVPFRVDRLVLVMSHEHALAGLKRIDFAQALNFDFIGLSYDSALHQHLMLQAERIGRQIHTRIRLRSFDSICQIVGAGAGIAILPLEAAKQHAKSMKLSIVQLNDDWSDRRLVMCARKFSDLSSSASRLVDALRHHEPNI